jgi:thymidylate kinase
MFLILEGADLVGKTSVSKQLSITTCVPSTQIWIELSDPKYSVISVSKTLHRLSMAISTNIIFDRSFLSEYVYGVIFGRDVSYIDNLIEEWSESGKSKVAILHASDELLSERFYMRGDDYVSLEQILLANKLYAKLHDKLSATMSCNIFDVTGKSVRP